MPTQTRTNATRARYRRRLRDPRWVAFSRRFLAGKVCHECGAKSGLTTHHLVYRAHSEPWEYPDDEMMPLCWECHQDREEIESRLIRVLLVDHGALLRAGGLRELEIKLKTRIL